MEKCEKCLYKRNCQFLATHKKAVVEDCTAFEHEEERINMAKRKARAEALNEFAGAMIKKVVTKHKTFVQVCDVVSYANKIHIELAEEKRDAEKAITDKTKNITDE